MSVSLVQDLVWIPFSFCSALNLRLVIKDDSDGFNVEFGDFCISVQRLSLYLSVCMICWIKHGSWSQRGVRSPTSVRSLLQTEKKHPWLFKKRRHVKVSSPLYPSSLTHSSLLSWRCLQWEWPDALLEERERFVKDWRDCALTVFRWRLPAFLWACLLQQHWYVRLEPWGPLSCTCFGNNQRAPGLLKKTLLFQMFTPTYSDIPLYLNLLVATANTSLW